MERIRYKNFILNDLKKKMVFIVGPRQVGKTWLAKNISKSFKKSTYLNYDNYEHRKIIINKVSGEIVFLKKRFNILVLP